MINPPGKVDDIYLTWIRGEPCELSSLPDPCSGKGCVAHHVTGRGMGGSKRDDRDAVPLCQTHHDRIHSKGQAEHYNTLLVASHRLLKRYLDRVVIPSLGEPSVDEDIF
ncbi:MAG: hypothetical protein V3U34_00715 [candidate division NC10 bacterium]